MVCTNPDLVVDRGSKREFCAGSVAKLFEEYAEATEHLTILKENRYEFVGQ